MLVLAGIIVAALLILALVWALERSRSRQAAHAAGALLERARRRAEAHSSRLGEVGRAALSVGLSETIDPAAVPSTPSSSAS